MGNQRSAKPYKELVRFQHTPPNFMSDFVEKDDKKFNELFVKQHPSCPHLEPETLLEKEDDKMEDLMFLQEVSQEEEPKSIEEKYEEQFVLDEISELIDKAMKEQGFKEINEFFPEEKE